MRNRHAPAASFAHGQVVAGLASSASTADRHTSMDERTVLSIARTGPVAGVEVGVGTVKVMALTDPEKSDEAAPMLSDDEWPRRRLTLAVAILAMAVLPLTVTGANLAFPAIAERFSSASLSTLSWALSGYSIVLAALTMVGGRLADRVGAYKVFLIGVAIYTLTGFAAALAPSAGLLVGARMLQGIGGAMIVPSSLALVLSRSARSPSSVCDRRVDRIVPDGFQRCAGCRFAVAAMAGLARCVHRLGALWLGDTRARNRARPQSTAAPVDRTRGNT